jgi:two-component system KDP operon response regulator KdpE
MTERKKILIVEDDPQLRRLLRISLESTGFPVVEAASVREAIRQSKDYVPELVILDLGLPDGSGIDFLRDLRGWSSIPVIILSIQDDEDGKILALDTGANDYVTKPFSVNELLARIRVLLRPRESAKLEQMDQVFCVGSLRVDVARRLVTVDGREARLTSTEFHLLQLFLENSGRVLTHKQILKEIWGPHQTDEVHYLRVYIGALRKKVERDPQNPSLILTEPGVGYRLKTPPDFELSP